MILEKPSEIFNLIAQNQLRPDLLLIHSMDPKLTKQTNKENPNMMQYK